MVNFHLDQRILGIKLLVSESLIFKLRIKAHVESLKLISLDKQYTCAVSVLKIISGKLSLNKSPCILIHQTEIIKSHLSALMSIQ